MADMWAWASPGRYFNDPSSVTDPIKVWCHPDDREWLMRMLPPICRGPMFQWQTSALCPVGCVWLDEGPHRKSYRLSLMASELPPGPHPPEESDKA